MTNLSVNCGLLLAQVVVAVHAFQPGEQVLGPDQLRRQNEGLKFPPEFFLPVRTFLAPDRIQVSNGQLSVMKLDLKEEGVSLSNEVWNPVSVELNELISQLFRPLSCEVTFQVG